MTWMKIFTVVVVVTISTHLTSLEASAVQQPPQPEANAVKPTAVDATESKQANTAESKGLNSVESQDAHSTESNDCGDDCCDHRRPVYGLCVHDFMEIELCLDFAKKLYELQTLKHASHLMQNYFMCSDDDEDEEEDETHPFPVHVKIYCPATQSKSSEKGGNKSEVDASGKQGPKTFPGFYAERQDNGDIELQDPCNAEPIATVHGNDLTNLHTSDDSKQSHAGNKAEE